jgi:hypothetical protein
MLEDNLTVFLHIPKTGGTTLNSIFRKQYNIDEIYDHGSLEGNIINVNQLNVEQKRKIKAISGHNVYGIHELYFSKPFSYFTMLRDPVDRVISLYYFLRNYKGYERLKGMSLEEYVIKENEAHNGQTVLLSGLPVNPNIEKAKENLKTFSVVGITEMFNESLFLLKKEYEWDNIDYLKQNITRKRPSKEKVSPTLINLIKKYNALDLELYEFAKQLLYQKLKALSTDEKKQLEKFKQDLLY